MLEHVCPRRLCCLRNHRPFIDVNSFAFSRCILNVAPMRPQTVFFSTSSVYYHFYYLAFICSRSNARSDWLTVGHYSPVMPKGRLRTSKDRGKKTYNEQLINLERSFLTGKS